MGLDSIYAMLARPVQALSTRKRNVDKVRLTDAIHPDSHEAPQSQLPPTQVARIKPNFIKANSKTSNKTPAENDLIDDTQEEIILPNGEHIKHIDVKA